VTEPGDNAELVSFIVAWCAASKPAAAAATHAAALPPAGAKVATQGHVLLAADFLATLAVEATIHHLDLAAGDKSLAGPSGPGLAVTRRRLTAPSGNRFLLAGTTWITC